MKKLVSLFVVSSLLLICSLILLFITDKYYELFRFIKPISLVQISGFIAFALLLEVMNLRLNNESKRIAIIIAFVLVMVFTFEVLWSFGYWFSTYELKVMEGYSENSGVLDTIYYTPSTAVVDYYFFNNMILNHSAKKNTLFLFVSIYLLYYLLRRKE